MQNKELEVGTIGRLLSKAQPENNKVTSKTIIPFGEKTNKCPFNIPTALIIELHCINMVKSPPGYPFVKTFSDSMTKDKGSSLTDIFSLRRGINSLLAAFSLSL